LSKKSSFRYVQWALVVSTILIIAGVFLIDTVKNRFFDQSILREGVIVYEVSYPEISDDHLLKPFLPKRMVLTVKKNLVRFETKAGIGLFHTGYIMDTKAQNLTGFLKLINVKYASAFNHDAVVSSVLEEPAMILELGNETASIAGLKCSVGKLTFKEIEDTKICYTEDVRVPGLNWNTPYAEYPGLFLEYDIFKSGIHMHLKLRELRKEKVSKSAFEIPEDYIYIENDAYNQELGKTFKALD